MLRPLLICLFLLVAAPNCCADESAGALTLGGAFSLSGEAAVWGQAELDGATLALEEVNLQGGANGRKVELAVEDTLGDNAKTVTALTKLSNIDKVKIVIGPTWLDTFAGALPVAERAGILLITPSASITVLNPQQKFRQVFSTYHRTDKQAEALLKHLKHEGIGTLGLLFDNDPFFLEIEQHLKKGLPAAGLKLLAENNINIGDSDFRTVLMRLKSSAPEVVIFGISQDAALMNFLKQQKQYYPKARLYSTESISGYAAQPEFKKLLQGVRFVAPGEADPRFIERYRARFGRKPVFSASNAYDAAKMVTEALSKGNATTQTISDYLRSHTFNTASFGEVSFDNYGGVSGGRFVIKEIEKDGFKVIN